MNLIAMNYNLWGALNTAYHFSQKPEISDKIVSKP
jgi:hypothetical protein